MSQMIQSLEQRVLMSVTAATLIADVAKLNTDAAAVVTAHTARVASAKDSYDAIVADLKILDASATPAVKAAARRQVATLADHNLVSHARIVVDQTVFLVVAKLDAVLGEAHGKGLLLHPTSTAFQKLVAKDITNLNTNVPAKLSTLQTELTAATSQTDTDANAIAASNSSIASLISTSESDLATKTTTLSAAASQVSTDAAQLATDLSGIPA